MVTEDEVLFVMVSGSVLLLPMGTDPKFRLPLPSPTVPVPVEPPARPWHPVSSNRLPATTKKMTKPQSNRYNRYLRKQLMLEAEAASREVLMKEMLQRVSRYSPEAKRRFVVGAGVPFQSSWSGNVLRYEALHRDLILLQQLKKVAAAAVSAQTPPESDRGLIEGEMANSDIGGSSALS